MRDMQHRKIGGVCAGFARYMDVDVVLVRIIWLALAIGAGFGFVAYVVAWIIMPSDQTYETAAVGQYAQ
jgi:phage shock protein C